ncbi:hypothetical protein Tco_1491746 [Tanacetum coccineum]
MIEPEKPLMKKDQIALDEELAREIEAEGSNRRKSIGRKRAKDKQEQETSKRQRVEDDKEEEELKKCFELAKEEDVAINAIPLATKVPVVGFQIHRRGKPGHYEIFRANGSSKLYHVFSQLLSEFDREDLVNLWRLFKAKHGENRPEEDFERVLWGDLRVMFEPDVESEVWRSLQGYKIQKMNIKFRGGLLGLKGILKLLLLRSTDTPYLPVGYDVSTFPLRTTSVFCSKRRIFETLGLVESSSLKLDLFSDIQEYSEKETTEIMTETMEQYMSKTHGNYGSGVVRPKINYKTHFELKGQYLKELRENTFSGSEHKDANEHIKNVLEIVDLFHIPEVTQDQVMLRVFPMSLTGAAS